MAIKSIDLLKYYDKNYFLNKVEGHKEFKQGKCGWRKLESIKDIDFQNKVILDVGCGRGEVLQEAFKKSANFCIGIDFSKDAIEIAKKYCHKDIMLINDDMNNLYKYPILFNFDIIFMLDILEHVNNNEVIIFLNKLRSRISKDTILIATTPVNSKKGDYKGMHINQFNIKKINAAFGLIFNKIEIEIRKGHYYIRCKDIK